MNWLLGKLADVVEVSNRFSPTHQLGKATGSDTLMQYSPTHRIGGDFKGPQPFQGYDYQSLMGRNLPEPNMSMQYQISDQLRNGGGNG